MERDVCEEALDLAIQFQRGIGNPRLVCAQTRVKSQNAEQLERNFEQDVQSRNVK
jgi:hypothetical protein